MTPTRATAYVGLASVLVALLARAGGLSVQVPPAPQSAPVVDTTGTQSLANELQQQTAQLRERLALSPQPRSPARNPFAFAPRMESSPPMRPAAAPAFAPVAMPFAEPPIRLIGVAERQTAAGSIRTAMITADSDELFMLIEGDTLGGRYRVKTIGADVVELTDLVTGAVRRLALQ